VFFNMAASGDGQEQPGTPVFADGSFWQFRSSRENWFYESSADLVGDYEVVLQNNRLRIFELVNNEKKAVTRRGDNIRGMLCTGQGVMKYLDCPIYDGKTWKTSLRMDLPGTSVSRYIDIDYVVKGPAETTTPAGTFKTLRIEGYFQRPVKNQGIIENKFTIFFNHECQCIVKFVREAELPATGGGGAKMEIVLIKLGTSIKAE